MSCSKCKESLEEASSAVDASKRRSSSQKSLILSEARMMQTLVTKIRLLNNSQCETWNQERLPTREQLHFTERKKIISNANCDFDRGSKERQGPLINKLSVFDTGKTQTNFSSSLKLSQGLYNLFTIGHGLILLEHIFHSAEKKIKNAQKQHIRVVKKHQPIEKNIRG